MKVFFTFIFFFLFCSYSSAVLVCGSQVYLDIAANDASCANTPAPTCLVPDGCSSSTLSQHLGCIYVCNVCCENPQSSEQTVYGENTIVDVPFGTEDQAAAIALNAWLSTAATPTCPDGYHKTGENHGAAYESFLAPGGSNSEVDIDYWVRAACTSDSSGSSIPLGNLTGSGGSSGLTQAETAAAVTTGVSGVQTGITTLDTQLQMINGVLTNLNSLYATGSTETNRLLTSIDSKIGTGSGGGLTQAETAAAVQDGVKNAYGDATPSDFSINPVVPQLPVPQIYDKPSVPYENPGLSDSIDFSGRLTTFMTDMKTTPLFSSFSLVPMSNVGSGSSSIPISFGSFGSVDFDLAKYAGVYDYIKGFVLLLGSYISVRILVLRK